MTDEDIQVKTIEATCPSCHQKATFCFIGMQRWPEAVAKRLNIPLEIALYQCSKCRSSISEPHLMTD